MTVIDGNVENVVLRQKGILLVCMSVDMLTGKIGSLHEFCFFHDVLTVVRVPIGNSVPNLERLALIACLKLGAKILFCVDSRTGNNNIHQEHYVMIILQFICRRKSQSSVGSIFLLHQSITLSITF